MGFREYVLKRTLRALLILWVAVTLNFIIPRMMPGDPLTYILAYRKMRGEARETYIKLYGLDKPLLTQYILYFLNIFRGDLGLSVRYYPIGVWNIIMSALPWTLFVFGVSTILQAILGVVLGIISGWKIGTKTDSALQTIFLIFWSLPLFWLGMVLLTIFAFNLALFPLSGARTIGVSYSNVFEFLIDIIKHAALPISTMVLGIFPANALVMRSSMVETVSEDYILTAEAKGLSERTVMLKHAARNALLPVVTNIGLQFGFVISGSILVEQAFSYPGLGRQIFLAVGARDFPLLQGIFFLYSITMVLSTLVVDIIYAYLDPRVKY